MHTIYTFVLHKLLNPSLVNFLRSNSVEHITDKGNAKLQCVLLKTTGVAISLKKEKHFDLRSIIDNKGMRLWGKNELNSALKDKQGIYSSRAQ